MPETRTQAMQQPSRLLTGLAIFIAILAVSTASIFIRFAQKEAPSLAIAALRLVFASLLLAPLALTRYRAELAGLNRREVLLGIASGLFLGVHFAAWISSLEYTTVASSVVLVSTGPLWVALLSPMFLNEKLSPAAFAGLGLSLIGGAIIALSSGCVWNRGLSCEAMSTVLAGQSVHGDFLALVGAWAVTGYLIIGRRLRAHINLVPYIFLVYSTAAVSLLITALAFGIPVLGFHPVTYVWLVLLALLPQLIGHSTYNWALKFLPAAIVAVTTLGEPIGSATLAYFILKEKPTVAVIAGGALILAGIYITTRPHRKSNVAAA
jgi:drug/metabolite transporter (DMT)-like permease